jgi:antitoxin YefM
VAKVGFAPTPNTSSHCQAYRKAVHWGWRYLLPVETTYTSLRERLASILKQVADDQEVVIVRRKGSKDVALVPAEELAGLMETAHLLRSPRNARRLLAALRRAEAGNGKPEPVEKLRREIGLGPSR